MTDGSPTASPWAGSWLTVLMLAICAVAFVIATGFVPATTRFFPVIISAACIVVALVDLGRRGLAAARGRGVAAGGLDAELVNTAASAPPAAILRYTVWFFGYLVAIWLVSLVVASGLFVAAFLWREAKMRWWTAVLSGVVVVGLVIFAGHVFHIRWPASLLNPLGYLR